MAKSVWSRRWSMRRTKTKGGLLKKISFVRGGSVLRKPKGPSRPQKEVKGHLKLRNEGDSHVSNAHPCRGYCWNTGPTGDRPKHSAEGNAVTLTYTNFALTPPNGFVKPAGYSGPTTSFTIGQFSSQATRTPASYPNLTEPWYSDHGGENIGTNINPILPGLVGRSDGKSERDPRW
jgi:hypothetical protein